ncbi:probable ribosome biogenesis protein RLP24 [Corticium candelabrum]|uniref:probable ribosome biogenesis protein RLP24 n=1 Tax=Corticium candelabrum TaxID=121492 RepID=UPI002E2542E0|nr:probable ribosome biogenesis protein RLP24 [Corticium candelabrum]
MRLEKCYFCSSTIYPGHGIQFVRNDCKIFRFCRSKCHKAFKKKRNPRKVRWTKAHRKTHLKEMKADSCLEFEMKRNVPIKYSRELWTKTKKAMTRIEDIKTKRQNHFIKNRLKEAKRLSKEDDVKEVERSTHLLEPPVKDRKKKMREEPMELVVPQTVSASASREHN